MTRQRARYIEPIAVCSECGREGRCRGAKTDTPLCNACRRKGYKWTPPIRVCSRCGRERPCVHASTEQPMCRPCANHRLSRREACAFCGTIAIAAGRSAAGAECGTCRWRRMHSKVTCERCHRTARPSAAQPGVCERCAGERVAQVCEQCGAEEQNYTAGRCPACSLHARVTDLAQTGDPVAVSTLGRYLRWLAASPKPLSTLNWITTSPGYTTLRELVSGELLLTHQALDQVNRGRTTEYLRARLVKHGALPERSEQSAGLAAYIEQQLVRVPDGPDRLALRRFATWKVQHDLARRERQGATHRHSDLAARTKVRIAADLLIWLSEQQLTLAELRQEHLEWWLAQGADHRKRIRAFITWTVRQKLTRPLAATTPAVGKSIDPLDHQHRLELIRALLTDEHLDLRDRVAGTLVLLYAQRISRIVLLEKHDLHHRDDQLFLTLGHEPLLLPEPLAVLTQQLNDTPLNPSHWIIYGGVDSAHLSEHHLRDRLHRLGLKTTPARNAASLSLAQTLPAAILSDLLGYGESTTARWTRNANGDWTRYAAHRPDPTTPSTPARSAGDPHSTVVLRTPAP